MHTMNAPWRTACALWICFGFSWGCVQDSDPIGDPLRDALPDLPPVGGAVVGAAGRLSADNFDQERVAGPASQGLVGDYFMRNDQIRVVVQAPGRAIGPCPYGGNIIDVDRVEDPAGDQLGEVSAFLQLGRTLNFTDVEVALDGSAGGPVALRFFGADVQNDFINLAAVGGFADVLIDEEFRAHIELGLKAAVTYVLLPGEARVQMLYTLYNPAGVEVATTWGTLSDTGAQIEVFHAETGFGDLGFAELLEGDGLPLVGYAALWGQGVAYGLVPVSADPSRLGAPFPISGVNVEIYDLDKALDAVDAAGRSLTIAPGGTAQRRVDLIVERDVGGVTSRYYTDQAASLGTAATVTLSGTVKDAAPGTRVLVTEASQPKGVFSVLPAGPNGEFSVIVPPGDYVLTAQAPELRRGPAVAATAGGEPVTLTVPPVALLHYTVKDRAGAFIPAKINVLGAPPAEPDRRFSDVGADDHAYGIAGRRLSRAGNSAANDAVDAPLPMVPGHYRVVVSRGPEWSLFEQVIDLTAAGLQIDAVLDHVMQTPGYVAADFHQHSHHSPDATVPPRDRVLAYLAEGVDFISSSEHDVLFDYAPTIESLGASSLLDSAVGAETTTFGYGHFNSYPLTIDPLMPNGGAFDWAGGDGPSVPPAGIFAGLRALGARVVQINHPRSEPGDFADFQENFDRAALTFDFTSGTFAGDPSRQPLENFSLGLPADAKLFSNDFDSLEVFNGFSTPDEAVDGERIDIKAEIVMRDWMNFLSFGFFPTAVGNSDSHSWFSDASGLPRSYVRVPDDSASAIATGIAPSVAATVSGKAAKDVVVTNGPFIQFTVNGKGIGQTVSAAGGPLTLSIEVSSPVWVPFDTVEVFANNTFDIPGLKPGALVPALCFTTKTTPSARCALAIGGARTMTVTSTETQAGVPASILLKAVIEVNDVDAATISSQQRKGARGKDLWLVVRAFGDVGLFPVIPRGVPKSASLTDLVNNKALTGIGVPALAFTNPIFVDADGGGWKAPFSP